MLSLLKSTRSSLAVVLLTLATLSFVIATPLNPLDDAPSFLARAQGGKINRRAPQAPNSACDFDSDCISGQCARLEVCSDPNGKEVLCAGTSSGMHCTRLALGSECSNNGDCSEGFCRQGKCAASKYGDACVSETQCTGASVCNPTGKCHTPGPNTLYPQATCGSNSQCKSKRCVSGLEVTDQYDVALPYLGDFPEYTRCDYFKLGEGKCRTFVDCSVGNCKNNKCALGADGDRCLYNDHCANVCGLNGICYSPPSNGSLGVGQPCNTGEQCFSNLCQINDVIRPLPDSPQTSHQVNDMVCYQSEAGGKCGADSDCNASACRNGVCAVLQVGQSCSSYDQCYTETCAVDPSGSSKGTVCILSPALSACENVDQCYSNQCNAQECPDNGSECGINLGCEPQPVLGSCRSSADCDTNTSSCDADKKCRKNQGNTCTTGSQCLSRNCVSRKCAAAATTTKATTITSSKTTSKATTSTKSA